MKHLIVSFTERHFLVCLDFDSIETAESAIGKLAPTATVYCMGQSATAQEAD